MKQYHMRRDDRQITDQQELDEILNQSKFIIIAMCIRNEPYIVTLSYGYDKIKKALYLHTGTEGKKMDFIAQNPNVCATVIEDGGYIAGECGHKYRTIVLNGAISVVEDENEKMSGIDVLLNHLENNPGAIKENAVKNELLFQNTAILRLDIKNMVGKKGR